MLRDTFQLGAVAEAIETPASTIKGWLHRDLVPEKASIVEGSGGPGQRREFSIFAVMAMGIAKEFMRIGITDAKRVFREASLFCAFESFAVNYGSILEGRPDESLNRNTPYPYHDRWGETLLILTTTGSSIFIDNGQGAGAYHLWRLSPYAVANVSCVFERVAKALGYDPRKVLDEAEALRNSSIQRQG